MIGIQQPYVNCIRCAKISPLTGFVLSSQTSQGFLGSNCPQPRTVQEVTTRRTITGDYLSL